MKLFFLEASVPLTKTYTKANAGVHKTPYPFVWEFTSHEEDCTTLAQFETLLKAHAEQGHCLIKGTLNRPLARESRAGSTDTNAASDWIVLDLDGLPETTETVTKGGTPITVPLTVDLFLNELGLGDVSYVIQWSASYGIENQRIRAHIFMQLDRAYSAPLIKQWLIQKNHEVNMLREAMALTKTGNSISWPLDISACQNDKLIYIAPPKLKGIKDPMGKDPRIKLVKRKQDKFQLSSQRINTTEQNKKLTHKRINDLRELSGFETRKFAYKVVGSQEVMLKPDQAIVTEMKAERGFVYFNLNGGDSWAYYHPENNPDYILNFKGEPAYLTKELLPDYWQELTSRGTASTQSNGITYLAFLDRKTGVYWRGTYDPQNDILDINPAKNETQLRHFAKQYGVPMGDFVPEWDLVFDPTDSTRVDPKNRTVNKFQPSVYMLNASNKPPKAVPKLISRVIHHALGNDQAIVDHFINWLATIVQTRARTRTAWVMHGIEGTGKGILFNKILRKLFGEHTSSRRMEELNEKYNHFMQGSFLIFVDEVQTKALQNEEGVMAKLRNFITEDTVALRQMYANAVEVPNYTNWIFSSNKPDPVLVKKGDRRFNFGRYQAEKLPWSDQDTLDLEKELQPFYDYLVNFPANYELAGKIIETDERDAMISISESSIDTVTDALLRGDMQFFMEQLPSSDTYQRNALMANKVEDYKAVLRNLMNRTDPANSTCSITRDELLVICDYVVGGMPPSPNKFTSLLKHHRIHLGVVWVDKSVRGIKVKWKDSQDFEEYRATHLATSSSTKKVVPSKSSTSATAARNGGSASRKAARSKSMA